MLVGLDTNFTVTSKAAEDGEFAKLYVFKWTTLLIPPTTLLVVNILGVVADLSVAVFQGFLKMLAGLDTNFTITSKAAEDGEFAELYVFKWTTFLIPPTTLLVVNILGVVAGLSDALNSGYEAWGTLFGKGFFALWVILHLYPFLKGLMGKQNRTPTIVVLWSVLLASVFSVIWVKIDPFLSSSDGSITSQYCSSIDC